MRMRLLGRFGVIASDGEGEPIQLSTRKAGALLAYLGMSRDYAAGREELAALLWGDCADQQAKQSLREEMRAKRHNAANPAAFAALARLFLATIPLPPHSIISAYCAFRDEMDPAPLTTQLRAQGHPIALPYITGKKQPLRFHLHNPGDLLECHPMGLLQPLPSAPVVEPDILLVPLLAFDRMCHRLGYGGGYYDRTIEGLRSRKPITAIGIGFSYQEVSIVPVGPHDVTLDHIITELNVF